MNILWWGMLISFLGSLPLGTLNVAAMQIGISESIGAALWFSFGSLLVEMIYVRVSLIGIDWIRKQEKVMKAMNWITIAILLALAVFSVLAGLKAEGGGDARPGWLDMDIHRFLLGALGCAINPIVIIFWFGWSTVLFGKDILKPKNSYYNLYIVGIGIGTLAGNCIFIFGGKYLHDALKNASSIIQYVIAGVFVLTAAIQIYKIATNKDPVSKMKQKKS